MSNIMFNLTLYQGEIDEIPFFTYQVGRSQIDNIWGWQDCAKTGSLTESSRARSLNSEKYTHAGECKEL